MVERRRGIIPAGRPWPSVFRRCEAGPVERELRGVLAEPAAGDRFAELADEGQVVEEIVDGRESRAEDLVRALQVMEVSAREVPARVAAAALVDRARVAAVPGVAEPEIAPAGEEPAVAGVARRQHAVEHVDPRLHGGDDVLRRPVDHYVAWPAGRQ